MNYVHAVNRNTARAWRTIGTYSQSPVCQKHQFLLTCVMPFRYITTTLRNVLFFSLAINPLVGKSEETYPPLAGLVAHTAHRDVWIPANQVASFEAHHLRLASTNVNLERLVRRAGAVTLSYAGDFPPQG